MDLAAWLSALGLGHYAEAFRRNDIDADVLGELSDADLERLGVASLGHRRRLLKAIALRQSVAAPEPQTGPGLEQAGAQILDPQPSPSAERRHLTVMFVDLVGSTALSARLDPEVMRDVLRAYQNAVSGEVARMEGHVAMLMGDGVLAYFGWPQAHEDDAERAARAGLALVAAVGQLMPTPGVTLACRAGIATGLVVVGDLASTGTAQKHAVVGDTPNLAARLQTLAAPGAVVVAPSTLKLLGGLFELEDLGAHKLKGLAEPVSCWRLLAERDGVGRFEARQAGPLLQLAGRDEELALMQQRWQQAVGGQGQVVMVSGEPGIGKSRLILELRDRLGMGAGRNLRLQCSPHHTGSALHPVIEYLGHAAGFLRDEPAAAKYAKLAAHFGDTATLPLVAALLGVPGGQGLPLDVTPQRKKNLTLQALADHLTGSADQRPALLVLEDAHWIDPTTEELLGLLIDRTPARAMLVVVTHRPEYAPSWSGRPFVSSLPLSRLGRDASAAIICNVAGTGALPDAVMDEIRERTDGVPLFVEEMTKAVIESARLGVEDLSGADGGRDAVRHLTIPATLHDALMARLDRLTLAKPVAQMGAALGREFSHSLLAAVSPLSPVQLEAALAELIAAGLIFRRGVAPDASYLFKHALVQNAAHDSLLKSRRQQLHAEIVEVLEKQFPERAEAQPASLAGHCVEAGQTAKAAEALHQAARQSINGWAMMEAIAQASRGLELLSSLPDTLERRRYELELRTTLGVPLMATKGMGAPEVEQGYARARELCRQVGAVPQLFSVLFGLWWFNEVRANLTVAHEFAEQLLAMAQRSNDAANLVQAHRAMACTLFWNGEFAAAQPHFDQATALDDPTRHRALALEYGQEPGILARGFGAHNLWYLGYPERALREMGEAQRLARDLAHPFSLAFALDHGAWLRQYRCEADDTALQAEADIQFASGQGLHFFAAQGTVMQGWAMVEAGAAAEGIAQMQSALAVIERAGARATRPHWLTLLAAACGKAGRAGEGLRLLDDAEACMGEARIWEAEVYRVRGALMLTRDGGAVRHGAAEALFLKALTTARRQQARSLELRAAISLARHWDCTGRRAQARDLLAPIHAWFTENGGLELAEAKLLLSHWQ